MTVKWIRIDERKSVARVPGRILPSDQAMIRRQDGCKGAYDFRFNGEVTTIVRTEHPEWS